MLRDLNYECKHVIVLLSQDSGDLYLAIGQNSSKQIQQEWFKITETRDYQPIAILIMEWKQKMLMLPETFSHVSASSAIKSVNGNKCFYERTLEKTCKWYSSTVKQCDRNTRNRHISTSGNTCQPLHFHNMLTALLLRFSLQICGFSSCVKCWNL